MLFRHKIKGLVFVLNTLAFIGGFNFFSTGNAMASGGAGCSNPTGKEGEIIYNNDHHTPQFCDGDDWIQLGPAAGLPTCAVGEYFKMTASGWACDDGGPPGGTDSTPNAFSFTDLTSVEPSTLMLSEILQITGIDTQATVTISGDGTPEFRICSDVSCGSVIIDWRSGFDTIEYGRYLQIRAYSPDYSSMNTVNLGVGTASDSWTLSSRHRYVFFTSGYWTGNLGGTAGADSKCQAAATSGGLSGTFMAWIGASSGNAPVDRFTISSTPYALPNGTVVADNWADLTDGTLDSAINRNEFGNPQGGTAWTNVTTAGVYGGSTRYCSGFASASSGITGNKGDPTSSSSTWTSNGWNTCDYNNQLYCFEQ